MPEWNPLLTFALAVVEISLVPGPDMLFVLANSSDAARGPGYSPRWA